MTERNAEKLIGGMDLRVTDGLDLQIQSLLRGAGLGYKDIRRTRHDLWVD